MHGREKTSGAKARILAELGGTAKAMPFPFLLEHSSWVVLDGASPVSTQVFQQTLKLWPTHSW
jgi:hypothetical protein